MSGPVRRLVPALAAALAALLVGAGSMALADGDHGHPGHESHHHHHGCHGKAFSAWDEEWLMMSIQGDRFEIAGGQLAQSKAKRSDVKALGARLVADHSKSLKDAVEVAQRLGIEVPAEPSPSQQWELRAVAHMRAFDHWYADLEVQDHKQDITEAQDEVEKGCNHAIRQLAATDLPTLKEHLALAEAALGR
jgi:putative membrane protein